MLKTKITEARSPYSIKCETVVMRSALQQAMQRPQLLLLNMKLS